MSPSVLLDTSFLITLVNANRANHEVAKQYYLHMLQHGVPMYFSAVVAAEFAIKQPVSELPLNNFRVLNFSVPHGQTAAALWKSLGARDSGDARGAIRDDVKLLAQAQHEGIYFILTEDESTLAKYCDRLREVGTIAVRSIKLADGFDSSYLRPDGQRDLL